MARGRRPEPCWTCGAEFENARESMLHAPCPNAPPRGSTAPTRAVSCPACAGPIDLRLGTICPGCGLDYPFADWTPPTEGGTLRVSSTAREGDPK